MRDAFGGGKVGQGRREMHVWRLSPDPGFDGVGDFGELVCAVPGPVDQGGDVVIGFGVVDDVFVRFDVVFGGFVAATFKLIDAELCYCPVDVQVSCLVHESVNEMYWKA